MVILTTIGSMMDKVQEYAGQGVQAVILTKHKEYAGQGIQMGVTAHGLC